MTEGWPPMTQQEAPVYQGGKLVGGNTGFGRFNGQRDGGGDAPRA
jgi:hypothetical protein